jgi:hypothetical protein
MSDSQTYRIDPAEAPSASGLFSGIDGLARAAGALFLGSFLLGMTIVLIAAA